MDPSTKARNCGRKLTNDFISVFLQDSCLQQLHINQNIVIFHVETWIIKTYYSLFKSHLAVQIWTVSYVKCFCKFLRNIFGFSFKNIVTLHPVTSLTVKLITDVFLQILQNFQNTGVFKTFSSKYFVNRTHVKLCNNIFFWKLHVYLKSTQFS